MVVNCFIISGKVKNIFNKIVYDVDVYGCIYDVNNNNVM